ncbi:MAG: VOC family protein [Myxococcaceae bacterium]
MPTAPKHIPDGYHTVTPYLTVSSVERLLDFATRAFDAEVTEKHERPDGSIGHAEVRIGDSVVMMGQASDEWKSRPSNLYLYVPDADSVYERALRAGGKSVRIPETQFYGDRCGGVEDGVGNIWWIATHVEDVSAEEMRRRAQQPQR